MASLTKYYGAVGKVFDVAAYRKAIKKSLDDAAKLALADFKRTTKTWKRQPLFTVKEDGEFARIVGTENEIYDYVTHGTPPHVIRARNAPNLAFPATGFVPMTIPMVVDSFAGNPGSGTVYAKEVQHPGTKARKFDTEIAKATQPKMERLFTKNFQDAQR